MIKIAINGFGRIGRLAFREMFLSNEFDIVAINDLTDSHTLAHLLKYDTAQKRFDGHIIEYDDDSIIVDNKRIKIYKEKDPSNLPWKDLNVDIVLECTGFFTKKEDAMAHINAGAKKVIISAPGKGDMKTIVYGVNETDLDGTEQIISAASCTTNCLAPMAKVINDNFKIKYGTMTTIHAYTNDQVTLDVAHKKGYTSRRGRACAQNIVPTSTGAASAIGKVIPSLEGKMTGMAYRVPVSDGSMIDLSIELKKNTTKEEINKTFEQNVSECLQVTMDPIVSSDVIGVKTGALVDERMTEVLEVDGRQLVKVVAWYDNEYGYTTQMMKTLERMFQGSSDSLFETIYKVG